MKKLLIGIGAAGASVVSHAQTISYSATDGQTATADAANWGLGAMSAIVIAVVAISWFLAARRKR